MLVGLPNVRKMRNFDHSADAKNLGANRAADNCHLKQTCPVGNKLCVLASPFVVNFSVFLFEIINANCDRTIRFGFASVFL